LRENETGLDKKIIRERYITLIAEGFTERNFHE